ncbi:MAG: hypothetical protein E7255_04240 [Lachnospiraceae bacterium]|nr:hypothetical protein [Lachnospiraceae bacterium]
MKRIRFFLLLIICLLFSSSALENGIDFFKGKSEDRYIYSNINRLKNITTLDFNEPALNDDNESKEICPIQLNEIIKGQVQNKDRIYCFVPKTSGIYKIFTTGTTNTIGTVYSKNLILVSNKCNKIGDENSNFEIIMELTKNKTYFIRVSSDNNGGIYYLSVNKLVNEMNIKKLKLDLTYTEDNINSEQWYTYIPYETGSYKILLTENRYMKCELYDEKFNLIMRENTNGIINDNKELANTLIKEHKYFLRAETSYIDTSYKIKINKLDLPNDIYFKDQWALLNTLNGLDINIIPSWQYLGNKKIRIGIVDTGVDYNHIDLKQNLDLSFSYNFVHNINDVYPNTEMFSDLSAKWGHGTQVTGIIASEINNREGIAGIAPNLDVISLKVLGNNLKDSCVYNDSIAAFISAIEYAEQNNIKILNCSFGGEEPSVFEQEAMAKADDILFIIAAGNAGNNLSINSEYPACYNLDNSIVVAAVNENGQLAEYSNYGGPTDIAAPGENILTTIPNNSYTCVQGTSIATPIVAAVAGLVWSNNTDLTPVEVKRILTEKNNVTTLDDLIDKVKCGGMINAYKAVTYAKSDLINKASDNSHLYNLNRISKSTSTLLSTNKLTNQIIVKFDSKINIDKFIENLIRENENLYMEQIGYLYLNDAYIYKCTNVDYARVLIKKLNNNDEVIYAENNFIRKNLK